MYERTPSRVISSARCFSFMKSDYLNINPRKLGKRLIQFSGFFSVYVIKSRLPAASPVDRICKQSGDRVFFRICSLRHCCLLQVRSLQLPPCRRSPHLPKAKSSGYPELFRLSRKADYSISDLSERVKRRESSSRMSAFL